MEEKNDNKNKSRKPFWVYDKDGRTLLSCDKFETALQHLQVFGEAVEVKLWEGSTFSLMMKKVSGLIYFTEKFAKRIVQ